MNWIEKNRMPDVCMLKDPHIPAYSDTVKIKDIKNVVVHRTVTQYLSNVHVAALDGIAPSFLGKGGEYKTLAACLIARNIHRRAMVQVEFIQCPVVFPRLERLRYDAATDKQLKHMAEVPFLVMDDFTQVRVGTWASDFLVEIAEARYGAKLPTLWTGNIIISRTDWSDLESKYGQAFARRLVEGSKGYTAVIKTD